VEDPVAHLLGEVEAAPVALEGIDDAKRVLVVAKAAVGALAQNAVERLLPDVAERRVAEVVAEPDRLGQILVERESPRHRPRDARSLDRVREPGAVVIALRRDEYLRLVLQPAKGLRVDDPVAVALEGRSQGAVRLRLAAAGRVGRRRDLRQPLRLPRPDPIGEGTRRDPGRVFGVERQLDAEHKVARRAKRADSLTSPRRVANASADRAPSRGRT